MAASLAIDKRPSTRASRSTVRLESALVRIVATEDLYIMCCVLCDSARIRRRYCCLDAVDRVVRKRGWMCCEVFKHRCHLDRFLRDAAESRLVCFVARQLVNK